MKKFLFTMIFAALFVNISLQAQTKPYSMLFYNVENLFDTINDPEVEDEEFTPEGSKKWTGAKYWKKMANLEKVFYAVASKNKAFPTVIGMCEVENRNCLEDIASLPKLQGANYQIVHFDGPYYRGVEQGFLYRPDQFKLEGSKAVFSVFPTRPDYITRDILTMWGSIDEEPFFFLAVHWPSRRGGSVASSPLREAAAAQMRGIIDSVRTVNPATKFVVMGDFNDDPKNKSVEEILGAKGNINKLKPGDMYNPFFDMHRKGLGTYIYGDKWNLLDNIVVSANLATGSTGELKLWRPEKYKFWGFILRDDFLFLKEGNYKGYPKRTYVGNSFQGGYSDHLPVYILIAK